MPQSSDLRDGEAAPSAALEARSSRPPRARPASAREESVLQDVRPQVDVCICTHNPELGVLRLALAALASQTLAKEAFRVTVIDNASDPPLPDWVLEPLKARGVEARIIREPKLGIAHARLRATHETSAPWVCFVDDDNVLAEDYLDVGLRFAEANPHVGAFGGRLLLPASLKASRAIEPFLPYLGIKDLGNVTLSGPSEHWCDWEPPTAGSFVHRDVLKRFVLEIEREGGILALGRRGLNSSVSCEDSFIMRITYGLGKSLAYYPKLVLYHHLRPHRLKLDYLLRLMYGYGKSHVLLERCLNGDLPTPAHYKDAGNLARTLVHSWGKDSKKSIEYAISMAGYHIASYRAHRTFL